MTADPNSYSLPSEGIPPRLLFCFQGRVAVPDKERLLGELDAFTRGCSVRALVLDDGVKVAQLIDGRFVPVFPSPDA